MCFWEVLFRVELSLPGSLPATCTLTQRAGKSLSMRPMMVMYAAELIPVDCQKNAIMLSYDRQ